MGLVLRVQQSSYPIQYLEACKPSGTFSKPVLQINALVAALRLALIPWGSCDALGSTLHLIGHRLAIPKGATGIKIGAQHSAAWHSTPGVANLKGEHRTHQGVSQRAAAPSGSAWPSGEFKPWESLLQPYAACPHILMPPIELCMEHMGLNMSQYARVQLKPFCLFVCSGCGALLSPPDYFFNDLWRSENFLGFRASTPFA